MITHRLKVTENRTIERLDHKPIVSKSNGADFIQFTFENPSEWNITGVLVVYMFNGTPYGSCVIDQDSNGNPLALTNVDGTWQLTVPVPYQCITSEGYLYTGISLFRTDVDASASTDTTPHIIAKLSTALLSQPIQILKNGGLDEIDVAASPNDDLLVRMKLFVDNFSTQWMENVDNKFDSIDKTLNGDSETGGGIIANVTTNTNNIQDLQKRIDELDDDVDALDIIINGAEEVIDADGSVEQEKVTGLVELQKEDAAAIEELKSDVKTEHNWAENEFTDLKATTKELKATTKELTTKTDDNTTLITNLKNTVVEQFEEDKELINKNASDITALKSTVENPVFDTTFSKTSTSAVQNQVLTRLFNGMYSKVATKAVVNSDDGLRFYIGQEQLDYDSSTGKIVDGETKDTGAIIFHPNYFAGEASTDEAALIVQLKPNQALESLTVTNSDLLDNDDSTRVPSTLWVNNLVELHETYPFLTCIKGSYVPTDDPLSSTEQLNMVVSESTNYYEYDSNFKFEGKFLDSDAFQFFAYGNAHVTITNVNIFRELGLSNIEFNGSPDTQNVSLNTNENYLTFDVPFFGCSEANPVEKIYSFSCGTSITLRKTDGSLFTSSDRENIINAGVTFDLTFVGNIKVTGRSEFPAS